jgi:hypothetical protein
LAIIYEASYLSACNVAAIIVISAGLNRSAKFSRNRLGIDRPRLKPRSARNAVSNAFSARPDRKIARVGSVNIGTISELYSDGLIVRANSSGMTTLDSCGRRTGEISEWNVVSPLRIWHVFILQQN